MTPSARSLLVVTAACAAVVPSGCGEDDAERQTSAGPPPKAAAAPPRPLDVSPHERQLRRILSSTGMSVPVTGPTGLVEIKPGPGTKVTEVACPDDVRPRKGEVFNCPLRGRQGLRGNVKLTLLNSRGDRFRFNAKLKTKAVKRTIRGRASLDRR